MNARAKRRFGFRTRLSIIIASTFIAAGAALLAVQYFVVQGLFASAAGVTVTSCQTAAPAPAPAGKPLDVTMPGTGCAVFSASGSGAVPTNALLSSGAVSASANSIITGAVIQQTRFLSDQVNGGLLIASIVTLILFTAIAATLSSWLAKRSLSRIGEVTATARDISERDLGRRLDLPGPDDEIKELGDTIDRMLDRLQLAFAAQDRFVANASHELRTPLTTTRAALEIPLAQGDVPTTLEPTIRRALRATQQSERLISALLSLSRGQAGVETFESVELDVVIRAELEELASEARTRGVTLESSLTPQMVSGDTTLLARAVRNLLENSIRHNIDGGTVSVRLDDTSLEVENTGEPLDDETVALLTEPFYRGEASRTSGEGSGLGLAIVDTIARTHGGELRLTARTGGGLIAHLDLPAAE